MKHEPQGHKNGGLQKKKKEKRKKGAGYRAGETQYWGHNFGGYFKIMQAPQFRQGRSKERGKQRKRKEKKAGTFAPPDPGVFVGQRPGNGSLPPCTEKEKEKGAGEA